VKKSACGALSGQKRRKNGVTRLKIYLEEYYSEKNRPSTDAE
jgi:hypothetical protein